MFSPSCGSTRTTTGAGVSIQRLVLSVPAPGILTTVLSEIASCLPIAAHCLAGLRGQRPEIVPSRYIYPWLKPLYPYKQATLAGTRVSYKNHLDGGGRGFGQDFIPLLQSLGLPRQPRAFEWCAGPRFIGFSLLGHGLCDTLCLADINPEAVSACERTIADNALTDRVSAIVPTIFTTSRSRNNGFWLFPIHTISSTSISEIFGHVIRTSAFTVIFSRRLRLF